MRKVEKPQINAKNTFLTCISRVRNKGLKEKLDACKDLIEESEAEFEKKATGELFTICAEKIVNGNVSAKDLEKVYTQRMVHGKSPGRKIYDKLISAPKFGICPLCSQRLVETLDHYLPKKEFPRLTTAPINLVPSCSSCNKSKLTMIPQSAEEETLHPYYDDIENDEWLFAKIIKTTPPTISYYVDCPDNWDKVLKVRVENHFTLLGLNKLYSAQTAVLMGSLQKKLNKILISSGPKSVSSYLMSEAESRYEENKNSWQTVFYSTATDDEWFCNGGFRI